MPQLSIISGKDLIKILEKLGYRVVRQRGSHFRLSCSHKKSITVPNYSTIGRGLLRKILRDVELSQKYFEELIK